MKKVAAKTLLFLGIVVVIDLFAGVALNRLEDECTGGDAGRIRYICTQDTSDVLIFGSSRAHYHYIPQVLSDTLNMSCFNCGQNGMGVVFFYGLLQLVCQSHTPKMVIMDIYPPYDLEINDNTQYISLLRPYYSHPGVDSIIWNVGKNEKLKMCSSLYRYNSRLTEMMHDYHSSPKLDNNGFQALVGHPNHLEKMAEKDSYKYDEMKLFYLRKLITFCKEREIKLFFVSSPRYGFESSRAFVPFYSLCKQYHMPFFDYYCKVGFADNLSLFANQDHLNVEGAGIYSREIAHEIKSALYK